MDGSGVKENGNYTLFCVCTMINYTPFEDLLESLIQVLPHYSVCYCNAQSPSIAILINDTFGGASSSVTKEGHLLKRVSPQNVANGISVMQNVM